MCIQGCSTKVSVVADSKGDILQIPNVKVHKKSLMQLEGVKWRLKTRPTNKLRLNMKRILNPKLKKEKIIVIEDSSSEENMESKEDLGSKQDYIQQDHSVSLEPVQGGHKSSKGKTTYIIEKGMNAEAPLAEEVMKERHEEDLIFKKFNIPWLSNQDSTLH